MGEAIAFDSPAVNLKPNAGTKGGAHGLYPAGNGVCWQSKDAAPAELSPDTIINLDHGDPTMYEAYWKSAGASATLVIPGWQTISYFSNVANLCWFLEPALEAEVRRIHRLVGNAVADDKHVVVGTGSSQLFQAALYALAPEDAPKPANVVSAVPYYSSYPAITDFLQSRLYRWAGDAATYDNEEEEHHRQGAPYIELVCCPNNPDGHTRGPVVGNRSGARGMLIYDLAYYWPQYTAITEAADHDIMLFTVSKSTGHAGTRIGWALVRDERVARKMTKFMELSTIGVSKDSQLRAAKILGVIGDGIDRTASASVTGNASGNSFFKYGKRAMAERWSRLREAVQETGAFSLPDFPSQHCNFTNEDVATQPAFAWMRCEKAGVDDCCALLREHKILTRSGVHFGMGPEYVRVSMLDRDPSFDLFIKRIRSIRR